jgi:putative transcriptional regulator
MPERDIGQEILRGIREIKAHKGGQIQLRTIKLKKPASVRIIQRPTLH